MKVDLRIHPPFRGGGTGSNPVGGSALGVPPEHRNGRFVGILAIDNQRVLVDLALG